MTRKMACGVTLGVIGLRRGGAADVRAKAELPSQRFEEECPLQVIGGQLQREGDVGFHVDRGVGLSHDRWGKTGALGSHGAVARGREGAASGGW